MIRDPRAGSETPWLVRPSTPHAADGSRQSGRTVWAWFALAELRHHGGVCNFRRPEWRSEV